MSGSNTEDAGQGSQAVRCTLTGSRVSRGAVPGCGAGGCALALECSLF